MTEHCDGLDILDRARANVEPVLSELLALSTEDEIKNLMVGEGIKGVPWTRGLDPISILLNKKRKQDRGFFLYEMDLDGTWGQSPISAHVNAANVQGILRIADFAGPLFSFWKKFENEEYPELVNHELFERAKRVTGYQPDENASSAS